MKSVLKPEFYDEFSCIADKCDFTCCRGWDISIDSDTYEKWKNYEEQDLPFCKNVKAKKVNKKTEYKIAMGQRQSCPFLDVKGLCNVVIQCGDEFLPRTCRMFPRQKNSYKDIEEYSISCTCPAVVDIISKIDGKIKLIYEGDTKQSDDIPNELRVRDTMISLMQSDIFSLKDRILLCFNLLLFINAEPVITKEVLNRYQNEEYLLSLANLWSGIKINQADSCTEKNELFLDMVLHYRKEASYHKYLPDIAEFAETMNTQSNTTSKKWYAFENEFEHYDNLMQNCIVSKIFANCVNADMEEMILSYQLIITEYIMVKHSVYLRWLMNERQSKGTEKIDYEVIRDYIVTFSRVIGYNSEGIREFWEESFDEAIWEFGYMLLLMN